MNKLFFNFSKNSQTPTILAAAAILCVAATPVFAAVSDADTGIAWGFMGMKVLIRMCWLIS